MRNIRNKKIIAHICYFVIALLSIGLFAYLCRHSSVIRYETRGVQGYDIISDFQYMQEQDASLPQGVRDVFTFSLAPDLKDGSSLVLYSVHENVEIYIAGELVYSMYLDPDSPIGHSPGNVWNEVALQATDAGSQIKVCMVPVYENRIGAEPDIFIGDLWGIYCHYIQSQLIPFICAVAAIIIGLLFIGYCVMGRKRQFYGGRRDLLVLGVFAIIVGAWKIADLDITKMDNGATISTSNLALVLIMYLAVPYALYEIGLFRNKYKKGLYMIAIISMAGILASLVMQVTNFKDFRETLWIHHCILVLLLLYSAFLLMAEKRSYGWNNKMKLTIVCIALCGLGTAGDLITYYRDANQSTSFAMMGLLFYILALGVSSLAEVRKWITMGKQASDYRELAYHDQLTGVYNRNAYAKAVAAEGFHPEGYGVVMLDLNCLKECNDVHGHDKGDIYICDSAGLIEETFGRKGNVYRMGGDEFCVLLEQATQEECASYKKQLQKLCEQYNRENDQPFTMQIACGFQIYDKDRDFDISDTLRRADHRMYAHKLHLKQMNQAKRAIS